MQRSELKRKVKEYSNRNKFYKLGLVRRLVKLKDERMRGFIASIPKVHCPNCNSTHIDVAHAEEEWNNSHWLYCEVCGEDFDDIYGLADALDEIRTEPYFDIVELYVYEIENYKKD